MELHEVFKAYDAYESLLYRYRHPELYPHDDRNRLIARSDVHVVQLFQTYLFLRAKFVFEMTNSVGVMQYAIDCNETLELVHNEKVMVSLDGPAVISIGQTDDPWAFVISDNSHGKLTWKHTCTVNGGMIVDFERPAIIVE